MYAEKTVIFGLDGACFEVINPWLDTMPTLRELVDRGGRTPLESCVPATTPPAWTTVTTGVNPGKHGIFGFYNRHRESYEITPVSARDVHARRLWDYTSEAGLTSLIVNLPVTHPARSLDGVLIPGYMAPEHPRTYPESLLRDIGHEDYRVYAPSEAESVPEKQLLDEWLSLSRSRAALATSLMESREWDVLFLEFQKTDGAVHKFDSQEHVKTIYECVDDCMGTILDAIGDPVNVFVVSDHGIGQQKQWAIALNTWLRDEGYLKTTIGEDTPDGDWLGDALVDSQDLASSSSSVVGQSLARVGLTRQRIERLLSAVGLYGLVRRVAPDTIKNAVGHEIVDRQASKAFYEAMGFSGVDVGVILNDAEFYEEGRLDASEYDDVRDALLTDLAKLDGPAGDVFTRVRPREEVYHGPQTSKAPDIVLEQASDYIIGSPQPRGKQFIKTPPGQIDHTRTGILVAAGPDIEPDWDLQERPSIEDVTPTLLHLLDCPLNERFDGQPLESILAVNRQPVVQSYQTYDPGTTFELSESQRESLEDRLKQMGYLE